MKRIYILGWLFLTIMTLSAPMKAQQAGQYSLNQLNTFRYNPAYAGFDNSLSITGIYRAQWLGIDGGPRYQNVNAHMPLYILNGGIGLNLETERLGASEWLKANVAYNYQLQLGKRSIVSLGLNAGLVQYTVDGGLLRTPDGEYIEGISSIDHRDQILSSNVESGIAPTFDFGAYIQSDTWEGGIAVANLTGARLALNSFEFNTERTYYAQIGANFDLNRSLTLHPFILAKSDLLQTQLDFSIMLKLNDNQFLGVTYRGYDRYANDAVAFIGGLKLNEKLTLAYAYDLTVSSLSSYTSGSHEILINYNLNKTIGKGQLPGVIYHPRSK